MFQPQTYITALVLMILSMLCWGSWANTVKLCPGYRFQLFYWDYVAGLFLGALLWALSLGSFGGAGRPFIADALHADAVCCLMAFTGGVIFNVANLLLVAAIDIAGLAVAFPIGIGLALVIGAASSYAISPSGNPWLLFGGIVLVLGAIVFDAAAYRLREVSSKLEQARRDAQPCVWGVNGNVLPVCGEVYGGHESAWPVCCCALLCRRRGRMRYSGQCLAHAQAARWPRACFAGRIYRGSFTMARMGHSGRADLVYGRGAELRCGARACGGSCRVLLHRSRSHHDFGRLGSLHLARICGCAPAARGDC